jgi:hypothetical protein
MRRGRTFLRASKLRTPRDRHHRNSLMAGPCVARQILHKLAQGGKKGRLYMGVKASNARANLGDEVYVGRARDSADNARSSIAGPLGLFCGNNPSGPSALPRDHSQGEVDCIVVAELRPLAT